MSVLVEIYEHCRRHDVRVALIGAAAMSMYGIARVTFDADLLTVNRAVLQPSFWADFDAADDIDIRKGDLDDPLAGVVRVEAHEERPVDLVVGKSRFQERVLEHAAPMHLIDGIVPVVQLTDLVLLKLFAGGPQDAWDIVQILRIDNTIAAKVEERVHELPRDAQAFWHQVKAS